MKILFICFEFPPYYIGGGATYSYNLSKHLANNDNKVRVLTCGKLNNLEEINSNLEIFRLTSFKYIQDNNGSLSRIVDDLINQICDFKPDIIQTQMYNETLFTQIANSNFDIPIIVTHHKTPEYKDKIIFKNSKWSCFDFVNNQNITHYISPSKTFTKSLLQSINGINVKDITQIYPGVSSFYKKLNKDNLDSKIKKIIKLKDNQKLIFLPLYIRKRKGLEFILDALYLYSQKNDIKVVISGVVTKDEYSKSIIDMYKKKLGNSFYNHKKNFNEEEMLLLYNMAYVTILPSKSEGLGLSVLEAMSCGCPVIATDVQGIYEIINNKKNGLLVKYGEIDEVIESLNYINNYKNRDLLTLNALNDIKAKFNIEKQVKEHIKVYKNILNGNEHSSGGILFRNIDNNFEFYLCKHSEYGYVLPKGHIEKGETILQCAQREIKEETGYSVLNPEFSLGTLKYSVKSSNKDINKKVYFFAYFINESNLKEKISPQHNENIISGKWFKFKDAIDIMPHKTEKDKLEFLNNILEENLTFYDSKKFFVE